MDLKGKRVAVIGGGVSGLAAAKLALSRGARVLISDAKPVSLPGAESEVGHSARLLEQDLVVISPGVDPRPLSHIPKIGELELAYRLLPKKPIVAITGTNGKTTTTSLIGHILKTAGKNVFVGGNIGQPFSEAPADADVYVLEVSSYQAEGLETFDAAVAVYLNLTPDHLDRYKDIEEYAAAKARLFTLSHGKAILNEEDPFVMRVKKPGDITFKTSETFEGFKLDKLKGLHNRQNQIAAILATRVLGVDDKTIQAAIDSFPGVKHRIELVGNVGGVEYYNDSKATNDDAASKAIAAFDAPIVWLAGGRDKQGGYALSAAAARGKVKTAIVFGEAKELIAAAFADVCEVVKVATLKEAVETASKKAKRGDVVLLSPACSSWDQFKNYEERGNLFKELVRAL